MDDRIQAAGQILDAFKQIELSLAKLYREFSFSFPQDSGLWKELSQDEEEHAKLVEELREILFKTNHDFELDKTKPAALITYQKGIEEQIERHKKGDTSRTKALYIALDYEKTLIEHNFYKSVKTDDQEYKKIAEKIEQDLEIHYKKLQDYIKSAS